MTVDHQETLEHEDERSKRVFQALEDIVSGQCGLLESVEKLKLIVEGDGAGLLLAAVRGAPEGHRFIEAMINATFAMSSHFTAARGELVEDLTPEQVRS